MGSEFMRESKVSLKTPEDSDPVLALKGLQAEGRHQKHSGHRLWRRGPGGAQRRKLLMFWEGGVLRRASQRRGLMSCVSKDKLQFTGRGRKGINRRGGSM